MQVGGRLVLGPVANAGLQMQSLASTAPVSLYERCWGADDIPWQSSI